MPHGPASVLSLSAQRLSRQDVPRGRGATGQVAWAVKVQGDVFRRMLAALAAYVFAYVRAVGWGVPEGLLTCLEHCKQSRRTVIPKASFCLMFLHLSPCKCIYC